MRLTAYAPGTTTKLGYLPEPLSVQASWAHNDAGALRVEYPSAALGGSLLARGLHEGMDVAVEVKSGAAWVSPRSSRFCLIARDVSLTDLTGTVSLTAPSYGWLLRKARNLETANLLPADHTQAGKRPFYSATAGTIMGTLLAENAARGGIPLAVDFTSTHDSLGNPWAKVATLYFELGVDLGTILESLSAQGLCDWWTEGTTLRMVNADAGATDRSASVFLHLGKDVTDAPSSESLEELATKLLVKMEDGKTLTRTASGGPAPWGTWEGYMSQGGVNTDATAILLADAELARVGRLRGQYTRAITLDTAPMVAWQPGDWVTAPTYGTTREKVRAQQVTMTLGADGVQASAILNDRVLDAELRRAKRLVGITGGSSAGGTGSPAPTPEQDRRQPAAPVGLVVQSDAILVQGVAQGMVSATWGQVTTATDSTVQEIDRYELWGRLNVAGAPWRRVATTDELSTDATWFDPGSVWQFKVRAMARYSTVAGAWSSTVTVLIESDVTPPSVPSEPTLRTKLGVILVDWNGLTASGGTMEPDMVRVEVGMATSSGGTLAVTDSLEAKGTATITGQPYGQMRWFALRSVDRSGNASAWSTRASIATTALVDAEAIVQRIDEAALEINASGQTLAQKLSAITTTADTAYDAASAAIKNSVTEYATNTSSSTPPTSGWGTGTPTYTVGTYTWMRTTITYGDNSTATTAPVLVTGNPGPAGADGTSVNIKGQVASSSALPSSGNTAGDGYITADTGHLWVWTGTAWTDAGLVRGPKGETGAAGADGISVTGITPYFRTALTSAGTPAVPTVSPPGSPWTTTEPAYTSGTYLYRTDRVTYSNGAFSYTPVVRVSAYTAAAQAIVSANGRNSVIVSTATASGTTNPTTGNANVVGDVWWRVDSMATRNAVAQSVWTGSAWESVALSHQVIASVDVNKLVVSGSAVMAEAVIDKLWTDVVRSRKITTDMLAVGRGENLVDDPYFLGNVRASSTDTTSTWCYDVGAPFVHTPATGAAEAFVTYTHAGAASMLTNAYRSGGWADVFRVPVKAGDRFRVQVKVRTSVDLPANSFWVGMTTRDDTGTQRASQAFKYNPETITAAAGWQTIDLGQTNAAGYTGMGRIQWASHATNMPSGAVVDIAMVSYVRATDASLIVDGGILARHVGAGEVNAGHLAANSVEADKIKAGALDSFIITSPNIRTAASGQRVTLDTNGLSVIDAAGTRQARLGALTSATGFGVEVRDPLTGITAPLQSTLYGTRAGSSTVEVGITSIGQPVDTGWITDTGSGELRVDAVLPTGRVRIEVAALLRYGNDAPTWCKGGNYWVGVTIKQGSTTIASPSTFRAAQEKFPASGVLGLRMISTAWVQDLSASATPYSFFVSWRAQTWAGAGNAINASMLARYLTITPL